MTDVVPADSESPHRHHAAKKTWVTDVNVYSKKKKDDINELLGNDDNDPLDEYGNYRDNSYNKLNIL